MFTSKRKRKAELLADYFKVKREAFSVASIEQYFLRSDKANVHQTISDKTYQDLDLDELFTLVDRTVSRVGQQYYYHLLRTIPSTDDRCRRFERLIKVFEGDKECKESVVWQLAKLNRYEAYHLAPLIFDPYVQQPRWFWVVPVLSVISIATIILSFFFPQLLVLLLFILIANYFVHYWNKDNLFRHSGAILQLLKLNQVVKQVLKFDAFADEAQRLREATQSIDRLGSRMAVFKIEATFESDLEQAFGFIVEIIKALLLIEPQLLFSVLRKLDAQRKQMHALYRFVAELDVSVSIISLRADLPYYAQPTITGKKKYLSGVDLYHPLLENHVANSLELHQKSALLTGSNMSGKTTFIRTVGINVIMAQTINTCFARELTLPRLKVHSAIRITDNLLDEKSYYFEEVLTIKRMLQASRSGVQHLFLLDELFKGTNTVERVAAGKSVLSYLNVENNIVLIATHDLELATYLQDTYDLYHFAEVVEDGTISFDYKMKAGNLSTTNAIRILALNGYPDAVVSEAKQLSEQINRAKSLNTRQ